MFIKYHRGKLRLALNYPEFVPVVGIVGEALGPISRRRFEGSVAEATPFMYDLVPERDASEEIDLSYLEEGGSVEFTLSRRQARKVAQGIADLLETGFYCDETDYSVVLSQLLRSIPVPVRTCSL
jgi:hypothetical protein